MIKEGRFVSDEFGLAGRVYHKNYPTFELDMVVGEYNDSSYHTFFDDLKSTFERFVYFFPFIKLGELNLVGTVFSKEDILYHETGSELVYKVFDNYDEARLPIIFNDPNAEEVLAVFFQLEYQDISGKICINNHFSSILFTIENHRLINRLIFNFVWGAGAEWFYNKYQQENTEIVRKAIIDFYDSSERYQELRISYYLYKFDLKIEKYTNKKVIVRRNNGQSL